MATSANIFIGAGTDYSNTITVTQSVSSLLGFTEDQLIEWFIEADGL